MKTLIFVFFIWIIIINFYGFLLCGIDKIKAKRHKWRISEKHLIVVSLIGGAVGVLIGMKLSHHKTQKSKFIFAIPLLCTLWIVITALIICFSYNNSIF